MIPYHRKIFRVEAWIILNPDTCTPDEILAELNIADK